MASVSDIRWEQLSEQVRQTLRWARAMEVSEVGTRTLVAGMIREEGPKSPPQQLLENFGRTPEQLFAAMRDMNRLPPVALDVPRPVGLEDIPPLSRNAALALEEAFGLRDSRQPDASVETRHLFAAILRNEGCTAFQALAFVLGDKLDLPMLHELLVEDLLRGREDWFRPRLGPLDESSEQAASSASVERVPPSPAPVRAVAFAPDGNSLASVGEDGVLRGWDMVGGGVSLVHQESLGSPQTALAYSPDGGRLACGGADGATSLFRIVGRFPEKEATLEIGKVPVMALAFASDGTLAIRDRSGRIATFSSKPESLGHGFESPGTVGADALAFAPTGDRLVSGDADGLSIWRSSDMTNLEALRFEMSPPLLALTFLTDDVMLAYDGEGRTSRWDLDEGEIEEVAGHDAAPTAATFTPDGSRLAVAFADGTIRVGPADETGGWQTVGRAANVGALAITGDGGLVASGGEDGEIAIWPVPADIAHTGNGAEWLADRPTTADSFGRRQLAAALARRLERISTAGDDSSFLLHVDGPWGAGKSSLLGLLEEELEAGEESAGESWLVVRFDAWRQSAVGPPWWALLTAVRETLGQDRSPVGRLGLRCRELLRLLRGYLLSSLLSLAVVAVAVALFLVLGTADSDAGSLAQTISAVIAVATTVWLLARGAARAVMWESAGGAKLYEQAEQNPMRALADHFAWLIARAGRKRVIFFVDDLDRCGGSYVVELLESIQTLVRDAPQSTSEGRKRVGRPPLFVVAADGRWIRRSYEGAYETFQDAVHEPGRKLGYLFLDKIFQLTFRVPEIGQDQRARYLDELLRLETPGRGSAADEHLAAAEGEARIRRSLDQDEILRVVEEAAPGSRLRLEEVAVERLNEAAVERATEHELQKFASLLEPNPRSMKRFVNAYSVALSSELIAGRLPDTQALALWTILRMRWPELADCLAASPDLVTALASADEAPEDLPEALSPLCDDAALAALLSFGHGALSADKIQAMAA